MAFVLDFLALCFAVTAAFYVRSARHQLRMWRWIEGEPERDSGRNDALALAHSAYRKEVHGAAVYGSLALVSVALGRLNFNGIELVMALLLLPAVASVWWGRTAVQEARLARSRYGLERRAEQALEQEQLAPKAWAARLAPEELPDFTGFEIGRVYQAGTGLMAGDFFDVHRVSRYRVAAVIGDVAGHGIESSITAFQAKYLLRVFLQQFRDPAQAFEEINAQLATGDRNEEFISVCVVVFDTEAGTLRYASAGHPAAFVFHEEGVAPLRSTGPLLMLDPRASYFSREIELHPADLVVMYTDGLSEARSGRQLFGENRIVRAVERNLDAAPDVLCKSLLDDAKDFAGGSIADDTAILAIRRD